MPIVRMSAQARRDIAALLAAEELPNPCVAIHKRGSCADVTRTEGGHVTWSIETPAPWRAHLMMRAAISSEIVEIDGIPFYFAVLEPEHVPPLELSVVNGKILVSLTGRGDR